MRQPCFKKCVNCWKLIKLDFHCINPVQWDDWEVQQDIVRYDYCLYRSKSNRDEHLSMLTAAYRSCVHEKTGYFPNLLMLGREVNLPVELVLGAIPDSNIFKNESECVLNTREKLQNIFETVRNSLKIKVPRKDCDPRISLQAYKVDDLVYYQDSTRTVGKSPKLKSDIWKGPCVVTRKLSDILFEIKTNFQWEPKILHFDRLKSYTSESVPEPVQNLRKHITENCVKERSITDHEASHKSKQKDLKGKSSKNGLKVYVKTNSPNCVRKHQGEFKGGKRDQRGLGCKHIH